ncbi:MAG: peptidylprolyl isomerase [Actinomycetota bacterium]|nr:peptidylprolyl isomerase [Actinomycetota bacterium]
MRTRSLVFIVGVLLALVAVGCGGGDDAVPTGVAAVVDGEEIKKSQVEHLIDQAQKQAKQSGRPAPEPGTPAYQQLRSQAVQYLVTQVQFEQEAEELDVEVTDAEINKRIGDIVVRVAGGDKKQFERILARNGMTRADLKRQVRIQLISDKVQKKVTNDVKVSDEEIEKYYNKNKKLYRQPPNREVRHILVKANQRALAQRLYQQLAGGADFAKIAKRYSIDPSAKTTGGKFRVTKGGAFDPKFTSASFGLKTGQISQPVKTQFGWHLIEALGPPRPAGTLPLSQVKESIRQQLLQQKKSKAAADWFNDLRKEYEDKVKYQAGYAPPATSTQTTATE